MNRIDTNTGKYVWIWEKYRPVILKLMMSSSEDAQEYKLSSHEFIDSNNKKTTGYTFSLRAYQGRNEGGTKKSLPAQDLLYVLKCSSKAEELMSEALYEFKMDKHFVLSVKKETVDSET